ncbi:MAG: HD domain-containing protein [Deltaproteobacteria bacterium]|nr:HD domain-containing protein [Deltaproteobacteria bacterium]
MEQKALKIMLIEDNPDDVDLLGRNLARLPLARVEIETCRLLADALKRLGEKEAKFDVILVDLGLPDSEGLDTFFKVHQQAPQTPIVVLSVEDDVGLAVEAVREGAQDYLVKGQANSELLWRSLHYSVERMKIEEALRQARDELEIRVRERTAELATANASLKQMVIEVSAAGEQVRGALLGIIQVISLIIETRDPYTAGHQRGVADLAQAIARRLGLPKERIEGIRVAALVHDLGKISTPAEILAKPARLSEVEMNMIRIHPQSGYDILKRVEFPWPIAQIVLQHHERLNGSGYPEGLSAPDILLEAKILAVADVMEAMCSHRPYRPALGIEKALTEIRRNRGILYDPMVVDACLANFNETTPTVSGKDQGSHKTTASSQPPPLATP